MVLTAELGALALVLTDPSRSEGPGVVLPDVHVLLVEEVDDPEGVDDIAGLEGDVHLLVDRQHQRGKLSLVDVAVLVRLRLDPHRPDRVGVVLLVAVVLEVPGPLLADRGDRHIGVLILGLDDRLVARCEGEKAEDEDERHDRVEDLDRHVVPHLDGKTRLPLATAVCDRRPAHQAPGDEADGEQHDPGVDPQGRDPIGLVGGRRTILDEAREETVELGRRTSGQGHGGRDSQREDGPTKAAF
ncbi:hypothetical protein ABE10_02590 [Bacillus toyonensis]|nr:hypothetical protein [Bacillus toyonensis]